MRILAIDLGKNKSVACVYEAESGTAQFQKLPTGIPAIQDLLRVHCPDRVVIEICPSAGWVGDLVLAEGLELQIANTSGPAWRWSNTKRKTDRDDALRLAQLSAVNQLPQVPMTDRATREWRALIRYRHHLVGRRTQIRNHVRALFDREGIALPKAHLCWTLGGIAALREEARNFDVVNERELWRGELKCELDALPAVCQIIDQGLPDHRSSGEEAERHRSAAQALPTSADNPRGWTALGGDRGGGSGGSTAVLQWKRGRKLRRIDSETVSIGRQRSPGEDQPSGESAVAGHAGGSPLG